MLMRCYLSCWLLMLACLGLANNTLLAQDEKLLDPDQAFALRLEAQDANTIHAIWTIADGYYMYRDRFQFQSETPGIELGAIHFPVGKRKEDEFFGRVEIYRHQVAVEISLLREAAVNQLSLKTVSQGCADSGVCYMPQTRFDSIELLPLAQTTTPLPVLTQDSGSDLVSALTAQPASPLASASSNLLEPDVAFVPIVTANTANSIIAEWEIAPGYYLYRDKFGFASQTDGIELGQAIFPNGEFEEDEFFGMVEIYHNHVAIEIPLIRSPGSPSEFIIQLDYQGCAEVGVCYMPQQELVPVALPSLVDATRSASTTVSTPPSAAATTEMPLSEQDQIATMLIQQRFWSLPAFFGFGLLLSFTPCVFPMIPILSSIIVGQGSSLSQYRAFMMSATYVLAMALTYTLAGVAAAMLGQNIQAIFQNPWVLGSFSAIFVLLALSMFGVYDLQLPTSWQSKLSEISNRQGSGTYAGVAMMGLLSALIVGPCVAAPLIGVLTVIATTSDATLGGAALFTMSLGMGVPLLIIGTSAGRLLPRAGHWMEAVKAVFGVLLLAVAIWMLERILPIAMVMLLWALLLIVSSTYMGALQSLEEDAAAWRYLVKGLGIAIFVYGLLMLVGVAAGGRDSLQPLLNIGLFAGLDQFANLPMNIVN